MAVKSKPKKSGERKNALGVTSILLGLVVLAFFIYFLYPRIMSSGAQVSRQVTIPRVSAEVTSSADGSSHVVDMDLVVEIPKKILNDIDPKNLKQAVEDVVKGMDFERITGEGNTDYIKSEITKELEKHLGENNLTGLYIVDIQSDDVRMLNPPQSEASQRRNEVLKGLFKNLED